MSFKYQLPSDYELIPIPTDIQRKAECRHLCSLLDGHKDAIKKIDGLVSYGIGIAINHWCKVCVKITFSHKLTEGQMFDAAVMLTQIPGMHIEGKREKKPGGYSFSGERIKHER